MSGRCGGGVSPPSGGGPGRTCVPGKTSPAWKNWFVPSERRLSPASPTNPRPAWSSVFWPSFSGSSGFGTRRSANGTSTLLVHADSARDCSSSGMLSSVRSTSAGIWARSAAAAPRSSRGPISALSSWMNGTPAASVSSDERTPGSASRANARSVGSASLSDANDGSAVSSVSRRAGNGRLERNVLARERARRRVQVRDEPLERALVGGERPERPRLAAEDALDVAVGILPERRLGGDRRVAVGGLPVRDRLVEAGGALA